MLKNLHIKTLLLLLAIIGSGNLLKVNAAVSTLNFTAACGGSGTADDNVKWTVTSDGSESTFDSERGIHYGTGKAAVQYIKLSTSGISGTITQIVVNASTASGVTATADITVGGAAFGGAAQSLTTTATDYTFVGSASGEIVVTVTKPSQAQKALYVKSVKVTYTTAAPTEPAVTVGSTQVSVPCEGEEGVITVTYDNISDDAANVAFFASDGTTVETYDWITAEIDDDNNVNYLVEANDGEARTAYLKGYALDNDAKEVYSDLVTITQAAFVPDYAPLPFEWEGGNKSDLVGLGISTYGLGSNYAVDHSPYNIKFDSDGDYIQIKTNEQPGIVTIGVKMIGGANTSYIDVNASADGETFTTLETLEISGEQNDILPLTTTKFFAKTDRFVRLVFHKGSNVGVGPITITGCISKEVTSAGMATFVPQYEVKVPNGVQAMIVTAINEKSVTTADVTTTIPAGAPVVLKNADTFNFPIVDYEGTTSNIEGNLLKVVTANEPAPAGSYVLYNGNEGVGFYEWTGAAPLAVGRVYLPTTKTGSRSYLSFGGDAEMTGIETMYNEKCTMNNEVFDLQGRRVAQPVKGLYIVNGKKVIK